MAENANAIDSLTALCLSAAAGVAASRASDGREL